MTERRRRRKKIPVKGTIIVFAVIVILGLVFLIASGGKIYKGEKGKEAEIEANVKTLKELDAKTPKTSQAAAPSDPSPSAPSGTREGEIKPAPSIDLNAEEEKIMSMTLEDYDDAKARSWFSGTVILGDSITMAIEEYGYLGNDVICAKIGAGFLNSDDLFADAVSKHPSVLFIFFGANDISNYLGNPELFIEQYQQSVESLRSQLPGTVFYAIGILPEQEGVGYEEGYEYREAYNEALKQYCEKTKDLNYLNADFILERNPDFYDADGIHPTASFYPRFLTFLADSAGLSGEAAAEN